LPTPKPFSPFTPPPHGRRTLLACVVLLAAPFGLLFRAGQAFANDDTGFRIVAHPENPFSKLPRRAVANLFLKETTRWADGDAVRPVDLKPTAPARKHFSEAVLNRSVAAVKSYWQQRIFSGRGVPPPELESDQAVIQYVTKHRGAVGYVSPDAELGKAKVLRVE